MKFYCRVCEVDGDFETKQHILDHIQAHEETVEGRDARLSIILNVPKEDLWNDNDSYSKDSKD
ncbi:MAG: hypothetical protein ABS939_02535 [Psychrobacillus sp.]